MSLELAVFCLLILCIVFYVWRVVDPKLDWNYETGERLLWYNDPFDIYSRKSVKLWTKKT